MQVWNVLHAARWKSRTQKWPKIRHLCSIAQLCRAISSQLRHTSTIEKKPVKQQYLPHMSSQYGELRPTSGWDLLASLGHPSTFQRVSRLGSVTARHSSSGRQPNYAALNRGCHLYSARQPSRWALVHILVLWYNGSYLLCSQSSPYLDHRLSPQRLDPPKPFQKFLLVRSATAHSYNMVLIIINIKSIKPSFPTTAYL